MDQEGCWAGKMAIPITQRSICSNLFLNIFWSVLCHRWPRLPPVSFKHFIWNWQLITRTPLTKNSFRHAKSPKTSFFLLKKNDGTFPWPDTMRPIFLTWSRPAAVAINHAGWWRIEEEIEVKRSRSQDLERGRGCHQFFSTPSPGHVGDTKSAWSWPVSLESKNRF